MIDAIPVVVVVVAVSAAILVFCLLSLIVQNQLILKNLNDLKKTGSND